MLSLARIAGMLVLVVIGTAACSGPDGRPLSTQQPVTGGPTVHPTVAALCPSEWQDGKGRQVWFTDAGGASIGGIELGTGTTGVVLAHMADADSCDWLPFGSELAAAGYRVLAFDFSGSGVSAALPDNDSLDANVVAAAGLLYREGVRTVVLMGASMGAAASLVAATRVSPPAAGVISLSAPVRYEALDAGSAVSRLALPVLYIAGSDDPGFAMAAQSLYDATPGSAKTLLVANSDQHGTALLVAGTPDTAKVRKAVQDFLKAHAPLSG